MKTIYLHRVVICSGALLRAEQLFEITEVEVLAENDENLVVNDLHYTTIRKEHSKYTTSVDKVAISLSANDSCWGNRIDYRLWSYSKKRPQTIKREIEAEIKKKFGFFLGKIDLSIIK